jgi:RTX calcium-binding nonapeptide repeat (4 copies)
MFRDSSSRRGHRHQQSAKSRVKTRGNNGLALERLENRLMLSTINWTNRGDTSGASDSRFDDVFGDLAEQARLVVDTAIDHWERTIVDFNYGAGQGNTYNVTISMNATAQGSGPGGVGANGGFTSQTNNKPSTGFVNMGWRSNLPPTPATPNASAGWFLDPTPADSSEFQGAFSNAFVRAPTGNLGGVDFFTTVLHELGHCIGLSATAQTRAVSFDTNIIDGQNAPASNPVSTLWAYNGNGSLWTEYDSGGAAGGPSNGIGPQHFAPLNTSAQVSGSLRVGAVALMNATGGGGNRAFISDIEADCARLAYGYTIATPSQFGTFYGLLDADGTLRINTSGLTDSDDVIDVRPIGNQLRLIVNPGNRVATIDPLGPITNSWPVGSVQRITIDTGSGEDFIRILPNGDIPVVVDGWPGGGPTSPDVDTLEVRGRAGVFDSFIVNLNFSPALTASGVNLTDVRGIETLRLWTEGGDSEFLLPRTGAIRSVEIIGESTSETMHIRSLDSLSPLTVFASGGDDIINVQTDPGSNLIQSAVTVHGGEGNDTVNLAPVDNAGTLLFQTVSFYGDAGSDTLNFGSNNADAVVADVTFDGGQGAGIDTVNYNDTAQPSTVEYTVDYDVFQSSPDRVIRHGLTGTWTLRYSGVTDINIHAGSGNDFFTVDGQAGAIVSCFGNAGDDSFTLGDGLISPLFGHGFVGGTGSDTITFDDHEQPAARLWRFFATSVTYADAFVFPTAGFERVEVRSGSGEDEFFLGGTYSQAHTIDAGGGIDRVYANGARMASLTVRGGSDSTHDFLAIDDRIYPGNVVGGDVFADRIIRDTNHVSEIYYSGFSSVIWHLQEQQNAVRVLGMSDDIAPNHQFSIIGNSVDDYVEVHTRDGLGNQTIQGNLHFDGGGVGDQLRLLSGSFPASFRFYRAGFDSTNGYIGGAGNGWISVSPGVENITAFGSPGNDTFAVEQFITGAALAIHGGAGDDSCTIGNGDMAVNLTNAAAFTFDGGDGSDRFTIANGLTTAAWSYVVREGSVVADISGVYSWTSQTQNIESQQLFAGSAADFFVLIAIDAGLLTECHGGDGYDTIGLGFSLIDVTLESIQGPVVFHAGSGGGRAFIDDADDPTGDVVHLTASTLGAFAGDTLFGPGGSLTFSNLTDSAGLSGLTLNLGIGADTVFARPLATGRVEINADDPGSVPGDTLNLATAGITSPLVNGTPALGSLSSTSHPILNWTGFEALPAIDNVAPVVVSSSYSQTPVSTVRFQFSEDVSQSLNAGSLVLVNTGTGLPVPVGNMSLTYDGGTHTATYTFPGYSGGILPNGSYSATVAGTVADSFGNPVGTTTPLLFSASNAPVIAVTNAQVVRDEGQLAANAGTFFDPDGNATVTFSASVGTITRDNVLGTWSWSFNTNDGPVESQTVTVSVLDGQGQTASTTFELIINNVAPTATISGSANGSLSGGVSLTLGALDPSLADQTAGFEYVINWGDGTPLQTILRTAGNGSGVLATHVYGTVGVFVVSVTARDKDNAVSTQVTAAVTIAGAQLMVDPGDPAKTALTIGGTSGNDQIQILPGSVPNSVQVVMNSTLLGQYSPTGMLIASGQSGDDTIVVDSRLSRQVMLYGEGGNDTLSSGNGNGILLGGDGDDTITGGNSRDILIGGRGSDQLNGGNGDDIVIGGYTGFDSIAIASQRALVAIQREWNRTDLGYQRRIDHLTGATGGGLNGANLLKATGTGATVFDDAVQDRLTGGNGRDWFFANYVGSGIWDLMLDRISTELLQDL